MILLIIIKISINLLYENEYFSIEKWKYTYITQSMETIDSIELETLINENPEKLFVVYFGRDNCSWCVEYISKIKKIFDICQLEDGISMNCYYLDTKENNDIVTQQLREKLGVDFVPTIVFVQNGSVYLLTSKELALDDYDVWLQTNILDKILSKEMRQ